MRNTEHRYWSPNCKTFTGGDAYYYISNVYKRGFSFSASEHFCWTEPHYSYISQNKTDFSIWTYFNFAVCVCLQISPSFHTRGTQKQEPSTEGRCINNNTWLYWRWVSKWFVWYYLLGDSCFISCQNNTKQNKKLAGWRKLTCQGYK